MRSEVKSLFKFIWLTYNWTCPTEGPMKYCSQFISFLLNFVTSPPSYTISIPSIPLSSLAPHSSYLRTLCSPPCLIYSSFLLHSSLLLNYQGPITLSPTRSGGTKLLFYSWTRKVLNQEFVMRSQGHTHCSYVMEPMPRSSASASEYISSI